MGNHHTNRTKEKILKIISLGTNRACVNIQPPGHKRRNVISSLHCSWPSKKGIKHKHLAPSLHQLLVYSLPSTEGVIARLISQLSFIEPLKMAFHFFGFLGFQAERVILLYFLFQCGKVFPTI